MRCVTSLKMMAAKAVLHRFAATLSSGSAATIATTPTHQPTFNPPCERLPPATRPMSDLNRKSQGVRCLTAEKHVLAETDERDTLMCATALRGQSQEVMCVLLPEPTPRREKMAADGPAVATAR